MPLIRQTWTLPNTTCFRKPIGHALDEQHFDSYEDVRKWLDGWFVSKEKQVFWRGIPKLPEKWETSVASEDKGFE